MGNSHQARGGEWRSMGWGKEELGKGRERAEIGKCLFPWVWGGGGPVSVHNIIMRSKAWFTAQLKVQNIMHKIKSKSNDEEVSTLKSLWQYDWQKMWMNDGKDFGNRMFSLCDERRRRWLSVSPPGEWSGGEELRWFGSETVQRREENKGTLYNVMTPATHSDERHCHWLQRVKRELRSLRLPVTH